VSRNQGQVRYVEVERDSSSSGLSLTEVELIGILAGIGIAGFVGYLLYQKAYETANAAAQAVQDALNSVKEAIPSIPSVSDMLPTSPGTNVPFTPPEEPPDLDTPSGYP